METSNSTKHKVNSNCTACSQVEELTTAVSLKATNGSWTFKRPEYFPSHDITDYALERKNSSVLVLLPLAKWLLL